MNVFEIRNGYKRMVYQQICHLNKQQVPGFQHLTSYNVKNFCSFAFNSFLYANNTFFIVAIVKISCFVLIWSNLILKILTLNYLRFIWLNDVVHLHPLFILLLPFHCHSCFPLFCYCSSFSWFSSEWKRFGMFLDVICLLFFLMQLG